MIQFSHEECMAMWTALQQSVDNSEFVEDGDPKPSPAALTALEKLNVYAARLAEKPSESLTHVTVTYRAFLGHLKSLAHQVGISSLVIDMWFEDLPLPQISQAIACRLFERDMKDDILRLYLKLYAQTNGQVKFASA